MAVKISQVPEGAAVSAITAIPDLTAVSPTPASESTDLPGAVLDSPAPNSALTGAGQLPSGIGPMPSGAGQIPSDSSSALSGAGQIPSDSRSALSGTSQIPSDSRSALSGTGQMPSGTGSMPFDGADTPLDIDSDISEAAPTSAILTDSGIGTDLGSGVTDDLEQTEVIWAEVEYRVNAPEPTEPEAIWAEIEATLATGSESPTGARAPITPRDNLPGDSQDPASTQILNLPTSEPQAQEAATTQILHLPTSEPQAQEPATSQTFGLPTHEPKAQGPATSRGLDLSTSEPKAQKPATSRGLDLPTSEPGTKESATARALGAPGDDRAQLSPAAGSVPSTAARAAATQALPLLDSPAPTGKSPETGPASESTSDPAGTQAIQVPSDGSDPVAPAAQGIGSSALTELDHQPADASTDAASIQPSAGAGAAPPTSHADSPDPRIIGASVSAEAAKKHPFQKESTALLGADTTSSSSSAFSPAETGEPATEQASGPAHDVPEHASDTEQGAPMQGSPCPDSPEGASGTSQDAPERANSTTRDAPERVSSTGQDVLERASSTRQDTPEQARSTRQDTPEQATRTEQGLSLTEQVTGTGRRDVREQTAAAGVDAPEQGVRAEEDVTGQSSEAVASFSDTTTNLEETGSDALGAATVPQSAPALPAEVFAWRSDPRLANLTAPSAGSFNWLDRPSQEPRPDESATQKPLSSESTARRPQTLGDLLADGPAVSGTVDEPAHHDPQSLEDSPVGPVSSTSVPYRPATADEPTESPAEPASTALSDAVMPEAPTSAESSERLALDAESTPGPVAAPGSASLGGVDESARVIEPAASETGSSPESVEPASITTSGTAENAPIAPETTEATTVSPNAVEATTVTPRPETVTAVTPETVEAIAASPNPEATTGANPEMVEATAASPSPEAAPAFIPGRVDAAPITDPATAKPAVSNPDTVDAAPMNDRATTEPAVSNPDLVDAAPMTDLATAGPAATIEPGPMEPVHTVTPGASVSPISVREPRSESAGTVPVEVSPVAGAQGNLETVHDIDPPLGDAGLGSPAESAEALAQPVSDVTRPTEVEETSATPEPAVATGVREHAGRPQTLDEFLRSGSGPVIPDPRPLDEVSAVPAPSSDLPTAPVSAVPAGKPETTDDLPADPVGAAAAFRLETLGDLPSTPVSGPPAMRQEAPGDLPTAPVSATPAYRLDSVGDRPSTPVSAAPAHRPETLGDLPATSINTTSSSRPETLGGLPATSINTTPTNRPETLGGPSATPVNATPTNRPQTLGDLSAVPVSAVPAHQPPGSGEVGGRLPEGRGEAPVRRPQTLGDVFGVSLRRPPARGEVPGSGSPSLPLRPEQFHGGTEPQRTGYDDPGVAARPEQPNVGAEHDRNDGEFARGRRPETLDDRLRGTARPATLADHLPEHGRGGRRGGNGGPAWTGGSGEHPYDRQVRRPASLADHPGPVRAEREGPEESDAAAGPAQ